MSYLSLASLRSRIEGLPNGTNVLFPSIFLLLIFGLFPNQSVRMIRRISSTFRRNRRDDVKVNGVQNHEESNGTANLSRRKTGGPPEPDHAANRQEVAGTFEQYAQLIHAARRPLPTQSGDGAYLEHDVPSGVFQDLKSLGFKDVHTLMEVMRNKQKGDLTDDKTYLMERVIQLVSGLPSHSKNRVDLTNSFLDELWNSLQHPPLSYMGDQYIYRQADGSNNSFIHPRLGAANTPYARSIEPNTIQPGALPDPGLIFDSLFARQEFKPHPNRVSSVFFDWASLIIHGEISRAFQ